MTSTFTRPILVLTCAVQLLACTAPAFAEYFRAGRMRPFSSHTRRFSAPAGPTRVIVRGNGDTEFDCWVYDRFDTLLGRDLRKGDVCDINVQNPSSGDLTIQINNYGDLYNQYELRVEQLPIP